MRRRILPVVYAIILAVTMFFSPLPASAMQSRGATPKRVVKVSVSEIKHFSEKDKNGKRTGILYDYLAEISKYADWEIQFVDAGMQEALDLLEAGEVDLSGCITRNQETEKIFDFPEYNNGYLYTCLITKADRTEYITSDYDTLNGIRVAVYAKAKMRSAELKSFYENNAINMTIVTYDSLADCTAALKSGEVDARLSLISDLQEGEKVATRFSPHPYYFGVAKGRSDIVRELNKALEMMNTFEPNFNNDLYQKYFGNNSVSTEFSRKELQYIEENPVVKVVCLTDWKPFSNYNEDKTDFHGISVDIIQKISRTTGFTVEFIPALSFEDAIKKLKNGEADVFCTAHNADDLKLKYGLTFSVPYLSTQTVLAAKSNNTLNPENLSGKRAAITVGFENAYTFESSEILCFNTEEEALEAVGDGRADFAVASYLATESYVRRHGSDQIVTTPIANANAAFSLAYDENVSSLLVSIIDKTIFSMEDASLHEIILQNTNVEAPVSFYSFVYSNPKQAIAAVLALCVLTIAIVFFIMRMRLKYTQRTALMGEAYQLVCEMANEYLFEYNFENSELKLPEKFCRIVGLPPLVYPEKSGGGIEKLFAYFASPDLTAHSTTVDFECVLPNGETECFRAVCAILLDDNKTPVRGLGKITSSQAELMEKRLLERRANSDGLTGLYIKSYCETLVNEFLSNTADDQMIAFMMIDLDNFKMVNDTLGHLGGDNVLKFLADRISQTSFETICGRFGGDEFFLFVKEVSSREKFRNALEEFCQYFNREFEFNDKKCMISVSVGAICCHAQKQSFLDLLSAADKALYSTKHNGRNGFTIVEQ